MTNANDFINSLKKKNIRFFTGVPDSILKQLSIILDKKKTMNMLLQLMRVQQYLLVLAIILQQKRCHAYTSKILVLEMLLIP